MPREHLARILLLQIDHDVALVAVEAEIGTALRPALRAEVAALVAVVRFDADHVGAEVAEQRRAVGTGQHRGDIEHAQPLEGARRRRVVRSSTCSRV
jgi:hypothetical protein